MSKRGNRKAWGTMTMIEASPFDTALTSDEHHGLAVLLECAEASVRFELEGRE